LRNRIKLGSLARIVGVGGENGSCLILRPGHDLTVSRAVKPQTGSMYGVMPSIGKPLEPATTACRSEISLGRNGGQQLDRFVFGEESRVAQCFVDIVGFDVGIGL
jgi:hypothetical protein